MPVTNQLIRCRATTNRRRQFLKLCVAVGAAAGITTAAGLAASPGVTATTYPRKRVLAFYHLHTEERLTVTYREGDTYLPDALSAIDYILRDHRTGEVHPIDLQLLDLLFKIQHKVGQTGAFHVISGYRSAATNSMLYRKNRGVAKGSLHIQGKAIDIHLPGTELKYLHRAALVLQSGGVGYYPRSGFIHVDVGRVRNW